MLLCHFIAPLLVAHGTLGPLDDSPDCLPSVHVHSPCDLVGFPFLLLRDITLQVMLCSMSDVMRVFHFLE